MSTTWTGPCTCTQDRTCNPCDAAITDHGLARDGYDFDPTGRRADEAADRYENWLTGDHQ